MSDDEINEIKERLTRLEVINNERWSTHEQRAADLKEHIDAQFQDIKISVRENISTALKSMPCSQRSSVCIQRMLYCNGKFTWLFTLITLIIVAILGVGTTMWHHKP